MVYHSTNGARKMQVWEIQENLYDLVADAKKIVGDLESAEGCETKEDLVANLVEALSSAEELASALKSYVKVAKKANE